MARDYVKLQLFKLWSFVLKNNLSVILSHLASTTSGDHNDMPPLPPSRRAPAYQNQALGMTAWTHVVRCQLRSSAGNYFRCSVRARYYHMKHLNQLNDQMK